MAEDIRKRFWNSRVLDLGGHRFNSIPSNVSPVAVFALLKSDFVRDSPSKEDSIPAVELAAILSQAQGDTDDEKSRNSVMNFLDTCNRVQGLLWVQNTCMAFSEDSHALVKSNNCRPDIALVIEHKCRKFPVLLLEVMSKRDHRKQLMGKLIVMLALMAELNWVSEGLFEAPTKVYGLLLPGFERGADYIERMEVSWDDENLYYHISSTRLRVTSPDELKGHINRMIDETATLQEFLRKCLNNSSRFPAKFSFRCVYRLSERQLTDLGEKLGATGVFVQFASNEAFVFASIDDADYAPEPRFFFKSSRDLGNAVPKLQLRCIRGDSGLEDCLVFPSPPNPFPVGHRDFYRFRAHRPMQHEEIFTRFADVVACLSKLHSLGFAHGDVRLENTVIDDRDKVLFIDLDRTDYSHYLCEMAGSVWHCENSELKECDWYQLGVSLVRGAMRIEDDLVQLVGKAKAVARRGSSVEARALHSLLNELSEPHCNDVRDMPDKLEESVKSLLTTGQ
eukprot:Rmarinus@m.15304